MMRWIVLSSLKLRFLMIALAGVLMVTGIRHLRDLPIDIVPEFSPLSIVVQTEAVGLSPSEVESLITVPMEADLLNGVPWLKSIESESITGLASIEMFFADGTDLPRARQMVQERLTQAAALPNVSSPPIALQPVSSASRIMNIGLSSKTVSLIDLSVQARWNIVPRLVGVPGVANVSIWGLRNRQMQVLVDPTRLHKNGVTLEQIVKTTGEAVWASPLTFLNSSTPGAGGFIDTPNQRLSVRHVSPLVSPETLLKLPVYGTSLALGEVANVVEGHPPLIGDAILKDGPGLILVVEKFPGFNTSEVTRDVEKALADMSAGMKGVEVDTKIYRPAGFVEQATKNLASTLLIGAALMIVGLMLMLRSWRSVLVVILAISVSLLAALFVLYYFGVSVNMMVIAGLIIAAGAIVDDAVLDADNLLRRRSYSTDTGSIWNRLVDASLEVRGPMVYATLILLLGVAPVLFMRGSAAGFFQPLVWAYVIAVLASMTVALTITPALSVLLVAKNVSTTTPKFVLPGGLRGISERLASGSPVPGYIAGILAIVLCIWAWVELDRSMVPSFKETDVLVEVEGKPGVSLPAMNQALVALIGELRVIPGVRNVAAHQGRAVLSDEVADVDAAQVWVSIDPNAKYEDTLSAVQSKVSARSDIKGQVQTFLSKKLRGALTGEEDDLTVRIYGHDQKIIGGKAEEIREILTKINGIKNPKVETQAQVPSIEVEVDLVKARSYGLKPGDVRRAASALMSGITVGALFHDQKVFDVVVWGTPDIRKNISDVQNLMIEAADGKELIRLSDVAQVREVLGPSAIQRQGVSRRIDVTADVDVTDASLSSVAREVARRIKDVTFPFEYHAQVLGEDAQRRTTLRPLYPYMIAAAVLMFLLLQVALASWRLALLSLLGIPVGLVGGLLAAWLAGGIFSLGSLLGFITVLGISTRSGIMLTQHFRNLESDQVEQFGKSLVGRGLRERFTPIVTSALVVGLLVVPFIVRGDIAGLEILHPAAVVVFGGLITSTLFTLFVVPAIYLRFGAGAANTDPLGLATKTA